MATLTPVTVGNAAGAGASGTGWDTAANGALGDNSDTSFGSVTTNATGNYDHLWELGDVDTDFGNMDTLSIVLRYRWVTAPSNTTWPTLAARVLTSDGATVLAAADSGGTLKTVASNITTTTVTNSASTAFNYVNAAANKAAWNGARVEIRIVRTRSKGGDSSAQAVYEADLTGTYTAAAAPEEHDGTLTATGGGVATIASRKGAVAAAAATGGGVASSAGRKGATVALPATGGGILTTTASTARSGVVAATGGGLGTQGATTDRSAAVTATGGGVATFAGEASGAGVEGALTATGGGVATLVATTDHPGAVTATAGGVATLSVASARLGAMLLSGGGVMTTSAETTRLAALIATGGGTAGLAGTAGGEPTGSITATGGGAATFAATTARTVALVLTGGGSVTLTSGTQQETEPVAIFTEVNDDGTLPRAYNLESNEVELDPSIRLLNLPNPVPELPSNADLAGVIALLVELGICTQASE